MKRQNVCFLIHLPQDLDLLTALIEQTQINGHIAQVLVYKKLAPKSPRITHYLNNAKLVWHPIDPYKDFLKAFLTILRSNVIVSAVETSEKPHRFGYFFTQIANYLGKKTISLQHGLENIGLTYSDETYPIEKINFASKKILIWSQLSELHPNIPTSTRKKCIPFGWTKKRIKNIELKKPAEFVVGVFENLHWNRYDDSYRKQFINDLITTAENMPQFTFMVKPHHEGRWLTERNKTPFKWPANLFILDPKNPIWEPYTGPAIIEISDIVITTPSTIALDAAYLNKPTLVAGYTCSVEKYAPLSILKKQSDWEQHILKAKNDSTQMIHTSEMFVQRHLFDVNCLDKWNSLLS